MNKSGMADVAKHAGLSISTVDRALNGREGVSLKSKRLVFDAIRELEYRDIGKTKQRSFGRPVHITTITPEIPLRLKADFTLAAANLSKRMPDIDLQIQRHEFFPGKDGADMARQLDKLSSEVDGVALIAPDTKIVRDAIGRAVDRGIHVITILSDIPDSRRDLFVGIDNRSAGSVAAVMLSNALGQRRGKVLSISGPNKIRAQWERHSGFSEKLRYLKPNMAIQPVMELSEFDNVARRQMTDALLNNTNLAGIYLYGGRIETAIEAIAEMSDCTNVKVVVHGLTTETFKWLENRTVDAVVQQDMTGMTYIAITKLVNLAAGTNYTTVVENSPIEIIIPENADSYRKRTITGMPIE
ncbi:MAG: LacI family DNA-binding transcriptional regulator [Ahrensia sp.]